VNFRVKSEDPKSHLLICSSINIFGPQIIDSGIFSAKESEFYGFFVLDGSPSMVESLYHFPGVILEIPRKMPGNEDI
jgi:hypothetical protein